MVEKTQVWKEKSRWSNCNNQANATILFPSLRRKESNGMNHFMGNGNAYFKIPSTE